MGILTLCGASRSSERVNLLKTGIKSSRGRGFTTEAQRRRERRSNVTSALGRATSTCDGRYVWRSFLSPFQGWASSWLTQGLRPGLHSDAASRLGVGLLWLVRYAGFAPAGCLCRFWAAGCFFRFASGCSLYRFAAVGSFQDLPHQELPAVLFVLFENIVVGHTGDVVADYAG
jgi:hypothetical protein